MNAPITMESTHSASLIVVDPNGNRTRVDLQPLPFKIGRHTDNHLVLRDSRSSRNHAQIVLENGAYVLEDLDSRHGTYLNGARLSNRRILESGDRIDFGFPDSYQVVFAGTSGEAERIVQQLAAVKVPVEPPPGGSNLARLRAVLEVARSLQTSFSLDDVLGSVVDAALAVTGCERGFLLLRGEEELECRVARDAKGALLRAEDLRVPRRVIQRALQQRRELLSMSFDPAGLSGLRPEHSVADLELRSVVCVPLVRINAGAGSDTSVIASANQTAGVLYMDSRVRAVDLAGGNRELLQSLAIEASMVLENARLLEEERKKRKIEEELELARRIQQSLLPRDLPEEEWFRMTGSSVSSRQVGGDYFDVIRLSENSWSAVLADVSGKGVSAALLASLLQGAFLTVSEDPLSMPHTVQRINAYLSERTEGAKYATLLYCLFERSGALRYINAGHCAPLVISANREWRYLEATAPPVGLIAHTEFAVEATPLISGDKLIAYSDGVTEAQNDRGEFFGRKRLREAAVAFARDSHREMHAGILAALSSFTGEADQEDDVTVCVMEYTK